MTGPRPRATSDTNDPARRLNPRIVDSDWLVMRGLARAIRGAAADCAGPKDAAVDFGCGAMPYRSVFTELGCRYVGADIDASAEVRIDPEGRLGAPDASFDLVLSFQVLEHVRDLEVYFAEARRVLKPGGRLILSTHGVWLYHPHPEDHRRWTREGLLAEIERHGFRVGACIPVVGPLAWTTVLRLTGFCYLLKRVPAIGPGLSYLLAIVMNTRALIEDWVTPRRFTQDNACIYVVSSQLIPESN